MKRRSTPCVKCSFLTLILVLVPLALAQAAEPVRVLYLTKSSGFEQSAIKREGDQLSHSERVITQLVEEMGGTILCTKDASLINADVLKNYDVVIFYTSGNLNEDGTDKMPPLGENGLNDLLEWIRNGGGFLGYHAATDTFQSPEGGPINPYTEMIGGQFKGHGAQFKGTVRVVSPEHPTMANQENPWDVREEWYYFTNLNKEKMHVLAVLDAGRERSRQPAYNTPNYPIIWCRAYGDGRVYNNGLGHREDTVWDNAMFQKTIVDAINWARGEGPLMAEPNYDKVVPDTIETP